MKTTKSFHISRLKTLNKVFDKDQLISIWRDRVRQEIRSLEILDLHDYYDFNLNISANANRVREQIKDGSYRSGAPLIYKLEKKFGISRHMVLPNPTDCLVAHTICDYIYKELISESPHPSCTFYSRSRHSKKNDKDLHKVDEYSIGTLWRKFQNEILGFKDEFKYVVTTDITNYYDSIGTNELRNVVASKVKTKEVLWDLLFQIINAISWRPDYLPNTYRGLPTINLEPIRLLGHCFLFELDELIGKLTNENFVRWMDDINFGVNSINEAYKILGDLNDLLKTRGLALNLQKTQIINSDQIASYLLREEHEWIDSQYEKIAAKTKIKKEDILLKFEHHMNENKHKRGNDKVTKRFFFLSGRIKENILLEHSISMYKDSPSLRPAICVYFKSRKNNKHLLDALLELLINDHFYDDVSQFNLIKLCTDKDFTNTKEEIEFIKKINKNLKSKTSSFDFYCYLWFASKYIHPKKILDHIDKLKNWWIKDAFLSRQVVPVLSRIRPHNETKVSNLEDLIVKSGHSDAASVVHNLSSIRTGKAIGLSLSSYLKYYDSQSNYPLPKYLTLYNALQTDSEDTKKTAQAALDTIPKDFWMNHWIEEYDLS